MLVGKMIEQLKKFNPKADVKLNAYNGDSALFILARKDDDTQVWIENKNDCDMGEALDAIFRYAEDNEVDELDFYMELLEQGITVEDIRKYKSEEDADIMKYFCEEHGLI